MESVTCLSSCSVVLRYLVSGAGAIHGEFPLRPKAKAAFQYMRDTARENNIDMSLDEINEEIREVRRLRKERNNGICGD